VSSEVGSSRFSSVKTGPMWSSPGDTAQMLGAFSEEIISGPTWSSPDNKIMVFFHNEINLLL